MTGENLICPYCGAVQETHEPDEISAIMCLTECERCDRAGYPALKPHPGR